MASIADLRYLRPDSLSEREQIRELLKEMGTRQSVIDWIFMTFEQQRRAYTLLQDELAVTEARFPEE